MTERNRQVRRRRLPVGVYFDNAGGDVPSTVIGHHLARNARIILGGLIAQYNLATRHRVRIWGP